MLFADQLAALLWKNVRSLRPLTMLVLLAVPVFFHGLGQVINDVVQAASESAQNPTSVEIGVSQFISRLNLPVHVVVFYSPMDATTATIMESLQVLEPKLEMEGFVSGPDMVKAGLSYLERVNGRRDVAHELYFLSFQNVTHYSIMNAKALRKRTEYTLYTAFGEDAIFLPSWQNGRRPGISEKADFHVLYSLQTAIDAYMDRRPVQRIPFYMETLRMDDRREEGRADAVPGGGRPGVPADLLISQERFYCVLVFTLANSIAGLVFFFYPMLTVVEEKRRGLVNLLRQMNLIESTYWIAMFFVFNIVSLLTCIVRALYMSLHPSVLQYAKFAFAPTLGIFFLSNMNSIAFSMLAGSLLRRAALVNVALGIMVVGTLVSAVVLSIPHCAQPTDFTWAAVTTYW